MSKQTYEEIEQKAGAESRPVSLRLSRITSNEGEQFQLTIEDEGSGVQVVRLSLSSLDIGDFIVGSAVSGVASFRTELLGMVRETDTLTMPLPARLTNYLGSPARMESLLALRREWVATHRPDWVADEYEPTGRTNTIRETSEFPFGALRIPIYRWVPEGAEHLSSVRDRVRSARRRV